ncbi:MAG: c-type cytochrome [Archangiaceae bacterium]|nr:c-type cytochrome [Archangiaceae bacterium]
MRSLCLLLLLAFTACLKSRPASDEKVEPTSQRVERGAYLANGVLGCVACHSTPDDAVFSRPVKEGTAAGAGGECWTKANGFPGTLCAPNLTADDETGLGLWSDGEIMRAVREGIGRHGNGLFPIMPYRDYAGLSDEDTRAVVAYLRTLPAVKHSVPAKELDFPVGLFIRFAPRPLEGPVPEPDHADEVAYGRYLGKVCIRCHSPVDGRGRIVEGQELGGGQTFKLGNGGAVTSVNLTPHPTGLGGWTKESFIARFRGAATPTPCDPKLNTVMPWLAFSTMTDEDLGALYAWLRTVPALDHKVAPWSFGSP